MKVFIERKLFNHTGRLTIKNFKVIEVKDQNLMNTFLANTNCTNVNTPEIFKVNNPTEFQNKNQFSLYSP